MKKLLFGSILTLFFCSFRDADVKYVYLSDYDAYIKLFNCSKSMESQIAGGRKLIITPRDNCRDLYVKFIKKANNKILEEGLYRCDTTTKEVNVESRNDNGSTHFIRKYYVPKRVGKWIFYKNGKKIIKDTSTSFVSKSQKLALPTSVLVIT